MNKLSLDERTYFVIPDLEEAIRENSHLITGKVLDFGCGQKPYEKYFKASEYTGLEYDCEISRMGNKADVFYDGHTFPFKDNYFDCAISTQVLEHVPDPQRCLDELFRVIKPGGYVMLSVPFLQEEHGGPYDFQRYTEFGLRVLVEKSGFEIIKYKKLTTGIKALISTINFYISICYEQKLKYKIYKRIFNLLGKLLTRKTNREGGLYVNNFIIARKRKERQ